MAQVITVTEMARSFSDIIGRVYHRGEEFDIKKGSHIVAHISPSVQNATPSKKIAGESAARKHARDTEFMRYVEEVRKKYPVAEPTRPKNPMTFGELITSLQARSSRMSEWELDEWENNIKESRKTLDWRTTSPWD